MKHTYKLLAIDAWADGACEHCDACEREDYEECMSPNWTWNDMHQVDTVDAVPETVEQFVALIWLYITPEFLETLAIDDDQYNIVLINKADGMPRYAVEYGNEYIAPCDETEGD